VPVIGELQDADYVRFIIRRLRADVVFHAAAHKHVPMMEANPVEAVKNNVFGTANLVDACREAGVERFVMISTDKVVEPVSVYGASKRIAEAIVLGQPTDTHAFIVVRFGNVLGSRGSIIPLFRKQILKGGPVTLTHPDTSRYFMTIPEASSLVLQAGGMGEAGGLYLLDMGEPLRIRDIAEQMIRFYGFEPETDIRFEVVGMRPGEKVTEELYDPAEKPVPTDFPRINKAHGRQSLVAGVPEILSDLHDICFLNTREPERFRNRRELRRVLARYIPTIEVVDDEPEY
jgi:FlaA1/EpsC-like NDP-sugar epimerase